MALPEPTFIFTIPSVYDNTVLSCRVYHPRIWSEPPGAPGRSSTWRPTGIILAHPYAPLGGSQDDPVIGLVAAEFLSRGFVLGTFNFRCDFRRLIDFHH